MVRTVLRVCVEWSGPGLACLRLPPAASVLMTESLENLDIETRDELELIVKAIHVLPVKE
jgi:hypothetical protein